MPTRIDISIGPVQGFIAQARRTRDLWGGSFLLSFLAARAMAGARDAGATIVQPQVDDDDLLKWASGEREGDHPNIGTITNHFAVETNGRPREVANAAQESFDRAWRQVCDAVWNRYVEHAASAGSGTAEIWKRQVCSFWEFNWTAGPPDAYSNLLARRKHWRSHRPTDEPGDKCTVMSDLQELSGYVRARDRKRQDAFWNRIRNRTGALDIRDNERLCAIALVKRLFTKVGRESVGWNLDMSRWPSTVYVGAVPWIRRAIAVAPNEARAYSEMVGQSAGDVFPMQHPPFAGLNDPKAGDFPKLDGNYLSIESLKNERLCLLKQSAGKDEKNKLAQSLQAIYDATDEGGRLGQPSSFYALLFADGDRLGKLLGELGDSGVQIISKSVASFVKAVPDLASEYDGVAIYAGGEDVLIILPVDKAIECAQALSNAYRESFPEHTGRATMSAAVVFAHTRGVTLKLALEEGRRLLDDVAKDGNGRDSLAVSVLKPSGRYCEWVSSWDRGGGETGKRAVASLRQLEQALALDGDAPGMSSSLIYRIRDLLAMLCNWDGWTPGAWGEIPSGMDMERIERLLQAEVLHSLEGRMEGDEEALAKRAKELTESVIKLLNPSRKIEPENGGASKTSIEYGKIGVDALMLARFLSDPDEREMQR